MPKYKIPAECHSDDHVFEVKFDAEKWLLNAMPDEIMDLARCGWGGDYPADHVAEWYAAKTSKRGIIRNHEVRAMFDYIEAHNKGMAGTIGFECHVDGDKAQAWLCRYRPDVFGSLQILGNRDVISNKAWLKKHDATHCFGCNYLKKGNLDQRPYCEDNGRDLPGTLERQERCKKEGWKKAQGGH